MANVYRSPAAVIIIAFLCTTCLAKPPKATLRQDHSLRFHPRYYHRSHLEPGISISGRGPRYPLTAAWFRDRYSLEEWNKTLDEFKALGGDTAILRAPSIVLQTREDFIQDPDFQWCRVERGADVISCYDDAFEELSALGLNIATFGKFEYEENYTVETVIKCPLFEKRLNMSRIYYRLVVNMDRITEDDPCNFNGSRVMVLFTSFAGVDAHELLLQSAHARNISVFFGLPQLPVSFNARDPRYDFNFTIPHLELTRRILRDHQTRFTNFTRTPKLYDSLQGYFYSSEILLSSDVVTNNVYIKHLSDTGESVHSMNKLFALSTYYISCKMITNTSLDEYLTGFTKMINTSVIDIISTRDGRGFGNGAFFWETERDSAVVKSDPDLFKILRNINPELSLNVTFSSVFTFSIQEIFYNLAAIRDTYTKQDTSVALWLNIEAFDLLRESPCLPVDKQGSGLSQIMDRVTKSRLDRVLTHSGAYVSKVTSDAWDPCFTCKASYNSTLASRIKEDFARPIIANCSLHSSFNRSVVVIGYNLLGLTQSFTVSWPKVNGRRVTSKVYGYYFELDWGIEHGREPSLMYTQLYDPYDVIELAPKGWIHVSAEGGYNSCSFIYDFTLETQNVTPTESDEKKYYLSLEYPKPKLYGQNSEFAFLRKVDDQKPEL